MDYIVTQKGMSICLGLEPYVAYNELYCLSLKKQGYRLENEAGLGLNLIACFHSKSNAIALEMEPDLVYK